MFFPCKTVKISGTYVCMHLYYQSNRHNSEHAGIDIILSYQDISYARVRTCIHMHAHKLAKEKTNPVLAFTHRIHPISSSRYQKNVSFVQDLYNQSAMSVRIDT